jgi:hypothetical protein
MAFTTARTSMLRGRPPGFPSGIIECTNAHCASVKSVAYVLIPVSKNLERSLHTRLVTARTFQTASKKYSSISSSVLPLVSGRKNAAVTKGITVQPAQKKNIAEYPKLPTVGRNTAAMPVPTA